MQQIKRHNRYQWAGKQMGFTMVELLLYVAISATLLFFIVLFLPTLLDARIKNQTIADVEQQGLQVMQHITQTIRNAEAITSPAVGASAAVLTMDVTTATHDPTVFDLVGSSIRMTEGSGSAIPLTNDRVVASGVTFHNVSRADTPGSVRIQFTLTHVNPSGKNTYTFSKVFIGSATLRQ